MINQRKHFLLVISFLLPIVLVISLVFITKEKKSGDLGFRRRPLSWQARVDNSLQLPYNSYYLAGDDNGRIYLANILTPLALTAVQINSFDTTHIHIRTKHPLSFVSMKVWVRPTYFYLSDAFSKALYSGETGEWIARKMPFRFPPAISLDECLPTSKYSVLFRAVRDRSFILGRSSIADSPRLSPGFLRAQGDPVFSVDGTMQYDFQNGKFAYVYFYRNQFVYSDSALTAWNYYRTIDTISTNPVNSVEVKSAGERKIASPVRIVNRQSYLHNNTLFVLSSVRADIDNEQYFKSNAVIDIYRLPSGDYAGSIYIPNVDNVPMKEFLVTKSLLIARFERTLRSYTLSPSVYK